MDTNILQERLLREKERLLNLIHGVSSDGTARPLRERLGELSLADNHPADIGTEMYEREKDLSILDVARRQLGSVEEALESLHQGTYGRCMRCGAQIPPRRLEAVPWAKECLECAKRAGPERSVRGDARPRREDAVQSSAYDAEDAWQDVARYGTAGDIAPEHRGREPGMDGDITGDTL